jgi:hypothetical protein
MSIELHIERLVLDEALLGGERAATVSDALTRELTRRLGHPVAAQALRGLGNLPSQPSVTLPPPSHPGDRLGPRIARAVQQSLVPTGPRDAGGRRR